MLDSKMASKLVQLALAGIEREYPYKMGNVLLSSADIKSPRDTHAVFNGHFDWHSSVHGHWTLVKLLSLFPNEPWSSEVEDLLDRKFTPENLQQEADYLLAHPSFERMYGWAWVLRLGMDLRLLKYDWKENFRPLENALVDHALSYLPKLDFPIRCGFHPESSFPMSQMLDWARSELTQHSELEALVTQKAIHFYGNDTDYPVRYEPSGNDFFSAGLNAADLMRRVYDESTFETWLENYLPQLSLGTKGDLGKWATPVTVSDLHDGHIVHLVGLNLSRSWCLHNIGSSINSQHPSKRKLLQAAQEHLKAGEKGVWSGSYEGEHWLGSFLCYALNTFTHNTSNTSRIET